MKLVTANPPSPFAPWTEWEIPPPPAELRVLRDASRSILSENSSPDLPFRYSVNPYRGCFHACAYCYARPSHEYLGFGAGTDFERVLFVKEEAPALLRSALRNPRWERETLLFSGNTDCYQPIELQWSLTRACLQVCISEENAVSIITKSALVVRDGELLAELARGPGAEVTFSIPFFDAENCRAIEPGAPPPARRFAAMAALAALGVPVGVNIAPVIPGLNDRDVPAILKAAREAGASWAHMMPVRLPGAVEAVFVERVHAALPLRAPSLLSRLRRMRGGELNEPRFGHRFRGEGVEWKATLALFRLWRGRLGFDPDHPRLMQRPAPGAKRKQLSLFSSEPGRDST